jgi:hypothetical protein
MTTFPIADTEEEEETSLGINLNIFRFSKSKISAQISLNRFIAAVHK